MTKDQVLQKVEQAWKDFNAAYTGLSVEKMLEPGVAEDWSVKDILAHVSWWEAEALQHLPHIAAGERTPRYSSVYGGIDAFNAQMTELKRGLSLESVQAELDATHLRLIEYLESVAEEQFAATRFQRRLKNDTYGHYPIHTKAIRLWRDRSGS